MSLKKALGRWVVYGTTDQKKIDAGKFRLELEHAKHNEWRKNEIARQKLKPRIYLSGDPDRNVSEWDTKCRATGKSPRDRAFDRIFFD